MKCHKALHGLLHSSLHSGKQSSLSTDESLEYRSKTALSNAFPHDDDDDASNKGHLSTENSPGGSITRLGDCCQFCKVSAPIEELWSHSVGIVSFDTNDRIL